jgi:hypothetical protein
MLMFAQPRRGECAAPRTAKLAFADLTTGKESSNSLTDSGECMQSGDPYAVGDLRGSMSVDTVGDEGKYWSTLRVVTYIWCIRSVS